MDERTVAIVSDQRSAAPVDSLVGFDLTLRACPLFEAWDGSLKNCRACNKALTGRQSRWCSDDCANVWGRNHWWTSARKAALKRDEHRCVRCGSTGTDYGIGERGLQVHHKTPVLGRHGETGCHHHVDGLETLCHRCHGLEHHGDNSRFAPRAEQLGIEAA